MGKVLLDKYQASIENVVVTGGTEVVVVTSYGNACGDNKVGIMTTFDFQCFKKTLRLSYLIIRHYSDVMYAPWPLNQRQLDFLFNIQLLKLTAIENTKAPHYWQFVRGIHRWSVDSPHKRPVLLHTFPCHAVVMEMADDISCHIETTVAPEVQCPITMCHFRCVHRLCVHPTVATLPWHEWCRSI